MKLAIIKKIYLLNLLTTVETVLAMLPSLITISDDSISDGISYHKKKLFIKLISDGENSISDENCHR